MREPIYLLSQDEMYEWADLQAERVALVQASWDGSNIREKQSQLAAVVAKIQAYTENRAQLHRDFVSSRKRNFWGGKPPIDPKTDFLLKMYSENIEIFEENKRFLEYEIHLMEVKKRDSEEELRQFEIEIDTWLSNRKQLMDQ